MKITDACRAASAARQVATAYHLPVAEVTGRRRQPHVMRARRALYAALRALGWSYPRIGRAVGRDHATVFYVLHGRKRPVRP